MVSFNQGYRLSLLFMEAVMVAGRLLFFLIIFTFSFTQFTSAGTPIDITGSQCEVVNGDSLKIKQIIVPGYTGTY